MRSQCVRHSRWHLDWTWKPEPEVWSTKASFSHHPNLHLRIALSVYLTGKSGNLSGYPTLPMMKVQESHSSIKHIRKFFGNLERVVSSSSKDVFQQLLEKELKSLHTISKICNWNPRFVLSLVTCYRGCTIPPHDPVKAPGLDWKHTLVFFWWVALHCRAGISNPLQVQHSPNPLYTNSVLHRMRSEI